MWDLQIDLVGAHRAISVEGSPCGRELGATPADQRPARTAPNRPRFGSIDRLIFVGLFRGLSTADDALAIVQPATVMRWHRAGFSAYWRWKSRARGARPTVPLGVRRLIRAMSLANPLWGAPRMHGELLKLGIDVGQTSVTKYMARRRRPPSQGWRTFLRNHAYGIVAMDLFVVPTISFQLLYGLLILRHDRRRVLWMGVTAHPTAECFFHIDALSSSVGLKVDFDMALLVLAGGLYRLMANRMRGYQGAQARQIFRDLIDMPADISISQRKVTVRFHRRAHLPIVLASDLCNKSVAVPWWKGFQLRFVE